MCHACDPDMGKFDPCPGEEPTPIEGQQHDRGDTPNLSADEPETVNVVLTFADPNGRRWLAGAFLGPLMAEDTRDEAMTVAQMPDVALTLVDFRVVRRG